MSYFLRSVILEMCTCSGSHTRVSHQVISRRGFVSQSWSYM